MTWEGIPTWQYRVAVLENGMLEWTEPATLFAENPREELVQSRPLEQGLNSLGLRGWELVAAAPQGATVAFIFRRPLRDRTYPPEDSG